MRKRLLAIVMSAAMVLSLVPSLAFAVPADVHSCEWNTAWSTIRGKDGKVVTGCDCNVYRAHKCKTSTCNKYDTETAVLLQEGPVHLWQKTRSNVQTCKETYDEYTCSSCYETKRENVKAVENPSDHVWDNKLTTVPGGDATCTKNTKAGYICTECEEEYKDVIEIPNSALGHNFAKATKNVTTGDYTFTVPAGAPEGSKVNEDPTTQDGVKYVVETKEATCLKDAYYVSHCVACDATEEYIVSGTKKEHNYTAKTYVPATCTEDGAEIMYCATPGCTEYKYKVESGKATGHNYDTTKGALKVTAESKAPTCTEAGYDVIKCAKCTEKTKVEVPAVGHKFATRKSKVADATCTTDEVWAYQCVNVDKNNNERCTEYTDPATIAGTASGHDVEGVDWTFVSPKCTEDAYAVKKCKNVIGNKVCGEVVEKRDLTDADFAKGGIAYKQDVKATGHLYLENGQEVPATCAKEGSLTMKCIVCDDTYDKVLAKTDIHTIVEVPAVAATYTKTGLTKGQKCSVCEKTIVAQTKVAKKVLAQAKTPTVKAGKGFIKVSYKAVKDATGYQIVVKRSGDRKAVTVKDSAAATKTIKKLTSGKTYKVYVRAYRTEGKTTVYGKYAPVKSIKVK